MTFAPEKENEFGIISIHFNVMSSLQYQLLIKIQMLVGKTNQKSVSMMVLKYWFKLQN